MGVHPTYPNRVYNAEALGTLIHAAHGLGEQPEGPPYVHRPPSSFEVDFWDGLTVASSSADKALRDLRAAWVRRLPVPVKPSLHRRGRRRSP